MGYRLVNLFYMPVEIIWFFLVFAKLDVNLSSAVYYGGAFQHNLQ